MAIEAVQSTAPFGTGPVRSRVRSLAAVALPHLPQLEREAGGASRRWVDESIDFVNLSTLW